MTAAGRVSVYDFRVTEVEQFFYLHYRLLSISPRAIGIMLRWKVGLEDPLEDRQRCTHAYPSVEMPAAEACRVQWK